MNISYETAERIRMRKAQYCRFVDTKQWDKVKSLCTPDAVFSMIDTEGQPSEPLVSPDALIAQIMPVLGPARSHHMISNSELTAISDTQIEAVWAMQDYVVFPPKDGRPETSVHGYGHYHEVWELRDGDWYMKSMLLKRSIMDFNDLSGGLSSAFGQ